jgi:SAM-dependent methyltransferase
MDPNGDVYYGMVADAYDWYLGEADGAEVDFFASLVAAGRGPGLELGCGTGRVLLELADRGLEVDGVDSSGDMLAICRAKANQRGINVGLFQQYAQDMRLAGRYGSVYCPGSTFMLFIDPIEAGAVLARIGEHLRPEGRVALTAHVPQPEEATTSWRLRREVERPSDRAVLCLRERTTLDSVTQIQTNELRNEVVVDGEVVAEEHHTTRLRWWTPEQFDGLLVDAGFSNVTITDGWNGHPTEPGTQDYVAVASVPGPRS